MRIEVAFQRVAPPSVEKMTPLQYRTHSRASWENIHMSIFFLQIDFILEKAQNCLKHDRSPSESISISAKPGAVLCSRRSERILAIRKCILLDLLPSLLGVLVWVTVGLVGHGSHSPCKPCISLTKPPEYSSL